MVKMPKEVFEQKKEQMQENLKLDAKSAGIIKVEEVQSVSID